MKKCALLLVAIGGLVWPTWGYAASFVNLQQVPGEATDLSDPALGSGAAKNRLGGFGSAIWYEASTSTLWTVPDSFPGDFLPFEARMQVFHLDVDPVTGALSNLELRETIRLKTSDGSENFLGLRTTDPTNLGNTLDPEAIVRGPNGNFFIADEYGPVIYEFTLADLGGGLREARFVRSLSVPARWLPKDADGNPNYVAAGVVTGRQNGRDIESLAITPDGNTLIAMLQDPLLEEGSRNSRNVRLARIDVSTGSVIDEYVYQLESLADINARVPGAPFNANQQGRNIAVNDMFITNSGEILVLERDNRGIGTENPTNDPNSALSHVGTKRIYRINLTGATDISSIALPASGELPPEIIPPEKSLFVNVHGALKKAGINVTEKLEGISVVPLDSKHSGRDRFAVLVADDNDHSLIDVLNAETGVVELFEVLTDGTMLPIDSDLMGGSLIPSFVYSFVVPEPATASLLGGAGSLAAVTLLLRRRQKTIATSS